MLGKRDDKASFGLTGTDDAGITDCLSSAPLSRRFISALYLMQINSNTDIFAMSKDNHSQTIIICYKNDVYEFYFASCTNIIVNELHQQRVNMMFIQRAK